MRLKTVPCRVFKAQTAVHIIYIWKISVPCKDAYSSILHLCFLNTIFADLTATQPYGLLQCG
ncbi:MAG: hypothetical protein EGR86_11120 [Ruminiclostridium sp.]|nr:hypothetical protein [Ruminiclostridium sp.]MBE5721492.1 hypothetical protein [Ruminiclostridium sp.]